ncbi:hypothetical protein P43SY_004070 [Pythium insidiosum]|uniref:Transmembrane protein n=1 Tax=Pythium insidiosum TaxID=114742 RepID=A0AAD5Q3X4_PYTIN|nr:hypothetical protein P43SY_004070 [Pythium insidiosum]
MLPSALPTLALVLVSVGSLLSAVYISRIGCSTSTQTFLWVTTGAWGLVALAHVLALCSTRVRADARNAWRRAQAASSYTRVVLLALAAALALALGTVGLSGRPRPDGHTELLAVSPGPVVAAWATLWLSVALVLTVHCGRSALADLPRNPETTPALAVLRCSCCTSLCKRLVLVAPLLGLACVALALWVDGRRRHCPTEAQRLVLGGALVFVGVLSTLAIGALVPPPSTERGRRRRHAVLLVGLVTFGVGAIAWGATGVHWLRRQDDAALRCAMAVRVVTAELMCAGSLMLLMTCCCRVERHLLPVHTPSVDAGMLSPHALRDPAHTQSTPERLALRERHGPSPHIAV